MTRVIAHRGSKGTYPENTLLAFSNAVDVHSDGVEFDVQLSKDNQLVILHDESLKRTTNGKGNVRDYIYQDLKLLNANNKYKNLVAQHIPLLSEVLHLLAERHFKGFVNIELKNDVIRYEGMEEKVITELYSKEWPFQFICSSFNFNSLELLHSLKPDVSLAYIYKKNSSDLTLAIKAPYIEGLHPSFRWWRKHREDLQIADKKIRPWTVNKEKDMITCFEAGIDGFHTDFPENAKSILKRYTNE